MNGREKILITGGLGNLGSWLTIYFSDKYDVYVLSKNISTSLESNYTLIQADITDIDELKLKLNIEFDYCIHTASYNEYFHENYPKEALLINSFGTRNLIEVLKNKNFKNFIYISTFHVYGTSYGSVTENTELNPANDYASTHLFAEYYLKQFYKTDKFPFVIFRLTNSYGSPKSINSTKWYLVLNDLVKSAYENNKIVLRSNGKAIRDFIWMGDVCSIIDSSLHLTSDADNIYNLSSGMTCSMLSLASKVQKVYTKRYNKKIEIIINKDDKTTYSELRVDNHKLSKLINIKFNDKLCDEIEVIFNLLENS